jgi:hypothetical protein
MFRRIVARFSPSAVCVWSAFSKLVMSMISASTLLTIPVASTSVRSPTWTLASELSRTTMV